MPATKLSKALQAESLRNDEISSAIKDLQAKGPLVRVPGTSYSVDLLTGILYLNEQILKELQQMHKVAPGWSLPPKG